MFKTNILIEINILKLKKTLINFKYKKLIIKYCKNTEIPI